MPVVIAKASIRIRLVPSGWVSKVGGELGILRRPGKLGAVRLVWPTRWLKLFGPPGWKSEVKPLVLKGLAILVLRCSPELVCSSWTLRLRLPGRD